MEKHYDRLADELCEPLDEHATFRLGIDYSFRPAFTEGGPMSRDRYEFIGFHTPQWAYFTAPPYEEYLRLYDMCSETCRLRATGLSGVEAAEAVRTRHKRDEALERLGIHHDLRRAFTQGRSLSREEYERIFIFGAVLPKGVMPYDDYVSTWYYGEMGVGPPSREEYMKQHSIAPPYEEYLELYKKYSKESGK